MDHWESLVEERDGGGGIDDDEDAEKAVWGAIRERYNGRPLAQEGHETLTGNASFFYTDDRMLASTDLGWLQSVFDTLKGLFGWVGLRTNVCNTVGMVCRPCRAAGVQAYEAYTRQITG